MGNNIPSMNEINKMRDHLFKKYNVRSEKELMKKLLGTSDKREIRQILLNKLGNLPPNDPLAKMARQKLNNPTSRQSLASDLLDGLTPEQRKQLKMLLKRQQR